MEEAFYTDTTTNDITTAIQISNTDLAEENKINECNNEIHQINNESSVQPTVPEIDSNNDERKENTPQNNTDLETSIITGNELGNQSLLNETVHIQGDFNYENDEFAKCIPSKRSGAARLLNYEEFRYVVYKEKQTGFLTNRPDTWIQALHLYLK